jgi:membrane-associated phospholipid phosphatase
VHWISDVAAGGLLGLACLAGLRWSWYRRPAPGLRLPEMIAILLVALTVSIMAMVVPRLAASVADYSVLPGLLLP